MTTEDERSRGAGWLTFASVLLVLAGVMRLFDALWAFGYRGALPGDLQDAVLGDRLGNYGWWWLGTGVLLIGAGFAAFAGVALGRWAGVAAAVIGALGAITWMPYYPVWSMVYVIIAVLVIYGLTVPVDPER